MNNETEWKRILIEELGFKETGEPSILLLEAARAAFLYRHYEQLTQIQTEAIPTIYEGVDSILISSTASGKTEAALIPVSSRLLNSKGAHICVYIAPTRALLNDLERRLSVPFHRLSLSLGIRHGDKSMVSDTENLAILLTTPESLDVLLCNGQINLSRVKYIICDELHQIFGTPRGLQLLCLLRRMENSREDRPQRIALSATLGNPDVVQQWFQNKSKPVQVIRSDGHRGLEAEFYWLDRRTTLRQIIRGLDVKKALVFCNARRTCEEVFLELSQLPPFEIFVHYSDLDRRQREYVEERFKSSEFATCVSTTTLELGIDIGSIEAVVLYDPSPSVTSFVQRVGRGGRRAGSAHAVLIARRDIDLLQHCAIASLADEDRLEDLEPGEFFSVIVQQIFSLVAAKSRHRIHEDELTELFKDFSWCRETDIESILDRLLKGEYLLYEPQWSSYEMGPVLRQLYNERLIYSNIVDVSRGIPLIYGNRRIGVVTLGPAARQIGAVIVFAGRYWEVIGISNEGLVVRLSKPVPSPIRPSWRGRRGLYLTNLVAQRMKQLLSGMKLPANFKFDPNSRIHLERLKTRIPRNAAKGCILMENTTPQYTYYTFAGTVENLIMQTLLRSSGINCEVVPRAEGLALRAWEPLDFRTLPVEEEEVRTILNHNWERLTQVAITGSFFNILPGNLKRREILSQVDYGSILERVLNYRGFKVVNLNIGLL